MILTQQEQQRVLEIASQIRLRHDIFNRLHFTWSFEPPHWLVLRTHGDVPDRARDPRPDGEDAYEIPTMSKEEIFAPDVLKMSPQTAFVWLAGKVRSVLQTAAVHEIEEMILVGGEPIFDPHRNESRPSPPNNSIPFDYSPELLHVRAAEGRRRRRKRSLRGFATKGGDE